MHIEPTFGQIVRERRVALDLTQVELARRVSCATVTIRKIEYDTLRPSVQIAERLAVPDQYRKYQRKQNGLPMPLYPKGISTCESEIA
jgi:transcriptional regulator with XRE-family HTH domain